MILSTLHPDTFVLSGDWVQTEVLESPVISAPYNYQGRILKDHTGAISTPTFEFLLHPQWEGRVPSISVVSDNGTFRVMRVGDARGSRNYSLEYNPSGGFVEQEFLGYVPGTNAELVANLMLDKLSVNSPLDFYLWNTGNAEAMPTHWNRGCWGFGFDLTGIVMRSSYWGGWTKQRAGHLMTTRHLLNAAHYPIGVGYKVRFLTKGVNPAADEIVEKTIVAQYDARPKYGLDAMVSLLDSPVPAGITPLMVAPFSSFKEPGQTYAASPGMFAGKYSDLSILTANLKDGDGITTSDYHLSSYCYSGGALRNFYDPADKLEVEAHVEAWMPYWAPYKTLVRPILSGDSGSPNLFPLNATTVAVNSHPTAALNALIDEVDVVALTAGLLPGLTGMTVTEAPPFV